MATNEWVDCTGVHPVDGWTVPPACLGQIVQRSYACDDTGAIAYLRIEDRSDRSVRYAMRCIPDDEVWQPWNVEPE
jgi:hypothetical protein